MGLEEALGAAASPEAAASPAALAQLQAPLLGSRAAAARAANAPSLSSDSYVDV